MNEDAIIQMLRELEIYGFRYTKDSYKDNMKRAMRILSKERGKII